MRIVTQDVADAVVEVSSALVSPASVSTNRMSRHPAAAVTAAAA
jgi:hypothetical protein